MKDMKIKLELQKHYDKLIELGYEVVGVFLYGSQNYQLDYENSDIDTKAIVLPTIDDIVLNKQPISTTIDMGNGNLCDVKDIRKMFECFKKQNINFVELLFTKYYLLNEEYKDIYKDMFNYNERIARYNIYASLNCISGMALEKYNALTHPYPSIKEKIDKYGYDSKQYHHICRLDEFIERYINGEEYKNILIPNDKENLLRIKKEYFLSLDYVKNDSKEKCDKIKLIKDNYIKENELIIDYFVENLMNDICVQIIKKSFRKELNND